MTAAVLLIAALSAQDMQGREEVYSGPQKGEKITPFKVISFAPDTQGKEVDYIERFDGSPTLIVFIHEITRPMAQMIRPLDRHAHRRKERLRSVFVLLPKDMNKMERYAPVFRNVLKLKSRVGVSIDGEEGPGNYGLNREVTVTVLLAKENTVVANWAIVSPNETNAPRIIRAVDDLLGIEEPTGMEGEDGERPKEDLEARVAALERQVRELRRIVDRLRRQTGERPERKKARKPGKGAPPKDPRLTSLLRRVINKNLSESDVDEAMKEIEEYVKDDAALRKELQDAYTLVLELGYGTEHAKEKIREYLGARDE